MVRKTQIMLEDDLSGRLLEEGAGETVLFALDGTSYEIDLSTENAGAMRQSLSRYTDAARKVSAARRTSVTGSPRKSSGGGRSDLAAVREWAKENGHEVSERGRVAGSVLEAYDAAH